MRRFGAWFGLETVAEEPPPPLALRIHDAAEDIWLLALAYTFNPGCLGARSLVRRRDDLWISKSALLARYLAAPAKRAARRAWLRPAGCGPISCRSRA